MTLQHRIGAIEANLMARANVSGLGSLAQAILNARGREMAKSDEEWIKEAEGYPEIKAARKRAVKYGC